MNNTGFKSLFFINRFVSLYFPVVRLMAVEDELRGGAIPDIRPRILTDQVCACVYVFYHPYLPKQSCPKPDFIIPTSHPEHWAEPGQGKRSRASCTSPVPIFPKFDSVTSEIAFHDFLDTPQGTMKTVQMAKGQEMNGSSFICSLWRNSR